MGTTELSQLKFTLADEISELGKKPGKYTTLVHHAIDQQAALTPESTAIICGSNKISYKKLTDQSNAFANVLITSGIKQGDRVGICLNRCIELIPVILGTIKSGACYIPMDPAYPEDRLAYILEDSAATAVISNSRILDQLQITTDIMTINIDGIDLTKP